MSTVAAELACSDIVLAATRLCRSLDTETADVCAEDLHELQMAVSTLIEQLADSRPRVIQALTRRLHFAPVPRARLPLRPRIPQPSLFPETSAP